MTGDSVVKSPPANAGEVGDAGSIPRLGRSPGGRNGSSLQCSCLEKPMDREAWWATVCGVAKSQTQLACLHVLWSTCQNTVTGWGEPFKVIIVRVFCEGLISAIPSHMVYGTWETRISSQVKLKVTQLDSTLCNTMDSIVHGILQARILEWVAFPFSRGSSQSRNQTTGLPHYQLTQEGSPRTLEWVAYPFSSRSFWPRNQIRVSCIAGRLFTNWAMREAP